MKDWVKAVKMIAIVFGGLLLFHLLWPLQMQLEPNPQYISSVRDTNQNIMALFGDKTILNNQLDKASLEVLEAKGELNKFPIVPVIAYDELPENYIYFLTKVENRNFFGFGKDNVFGMSFSGAARLAKGKADGGSNIPQQLLKNVIHKKEGIGTIYMSRKYGEQLAAFQMYKAASPEEILLAYTNYAGNFWYEQDFSGLILAAYSIFNRPPHKLNDLEMLLTVKTLKSGQQLKELCNDKRANKEEIKARILHYFELVANTTIDRDRLEAMRSMELRFEGNNTLRRTTALTQFFKDKRVRDLNINAPQYVTSISAENQRKVQQAADRFRAYYKSSMRVRGYTLEYTVLAIDIKTGLIEATFGNSRNSAAMANFTDYGNGFQCGSVLKPLVFLELFENYGFEENSALFNGNLNQFSYNPRNVNNKLLNTNVFVRDVFKYSLNKAAVNHRIYADPLEVARNVEQNFNDMGIAINPKYALGESYILGTRTMTPLDLAKAYHMIFNKGVSIPISPWKYVIDAQKGDTIFNSAKHKRKIIYKEEHVNRIKNLLPASFESGGTCYRLLKFLPENRSYYGKTGTTGNAVDGWTVLSDGKKIVVAWAGYLKNEKGILSNRNAPPIPTKSGGGSAGILAAMTYDRLYR